MWIRRLPGAPPSHNTRISYPNYKTGKDAPSLSWHIVCCLYLCLRPGILSLSLKWQATSTHVTPQPANIAARRQGVWDERASPSINHRNVQRVANGV